MLAAKISATRRVLLRGTRNLRSTRRAWLILREIRQKVSQSRNDCRRESDKKMRLDQRCLRKVQLYHYELVESALLAGVALSKVDAMRPFLEKYGPQSCTP